MKTMDEIIAAIQEQSIEARNRNDDQVAAIDQEIYEKEHRRAAMNAECEAFQIKMDAEFEHDLARLRLQRTMLTAPKVVEEEKPAEKEDPDRIAKAA